jgi:hypothetical protein
LIVTAARASVGSKDPEIWGHIHVGSSHDNVDVDVLEAPLEGPPTEVVLSRAGAGVSTWSAGRVFARSVDYLAFDSGPPRA